MRPSPTSDPLSALLKHNQWATHQVLGLCRRLTPEQFHRRFDIGFGSLHDTLRHLISCMRGWADDNAGRPGRPSLGDQDRQYSIDEFAKLLDDATDEYRSLIESSRTKLDELIDVTFSEKIYQFTRGVALVHPLVHGTHHRAQCLNILRRLNVPGVSNKLPDLDVNDWQYETETKP